MELTIVAAGVFIALGVQSWSEERAWKNRARDSLDTMRGEIFYYYAVAVEARIDAPCIMAQIDRLQARVEASGGQNAPAPTYAEPAYGTSTYVLRMPDRNMPEGQWQVANSDGVAAHFDKATRKWLDAAHSNLTFLRELNAQNNATVRRLAILSRPMTLDAATRFSVIQELYELRGRIDEADYISGQTIWDWQQAGMVPPLNDAWKWIATGGTIRFCRAHGYPLRPLNEAAKAIKDL